MTQGRIGQLEEIVRELEGRNLMHEVLIAQLIGRAGDASGNMNLFVNELLTSVGKDLEANGMRVTEKDEAERFANALEAFAQFATVMQNALKGAGSRKTN